MDIDIHGLKRSFIKNFVSKESQEEAETALNISEQRKLFVSKILDHKSGILDKTILRTLDPEITDDEIINLLTPGEVEIERDLYYLISGNDKIDDKVMQVDFALKTIHEKKLGGILVNLRRDRIYFVSKSDPSKKFIGELKRR